MEEKKEISPLMAWLGIGGVGAGGAGMAAGFIPRPYGLYVAIAILCLVLVAAVGYIIVVRVLKKRAGAGFTSQLLQSASGARDVNDPEVRANLANLRQKFEAGVREFGGKRGPYFLPWYLMIGPPGWGKTEALRHANIPFRGVTEPYQGTGGTRNMDWWMFNDAVVLDTAGKMVFGDEGGKGDWGSEGSPEWREFLKMLKKSRSACPINGLFLTLSVKGLIDKDRKKVKEYATKMQRQLEIIQTELDVRFPVYVMVTFSDLLVGFSEFFAALQGAAQIKDDEFPFSQQMFGWSNPAPLDEPFKPDQVVAWIRDLCAKIAPMRYPLLRDPTVISDTEGRRLNEVDEMYGFPESLERFARNLQTCLEIVFSNTNWTDKPPFFRGIYFGSSMRKGAALDLALAESLDVDVSELRAGREWDDDNQSFFIHDLFVKRAFRERGLVTKATNTQAMLRQRQVITLAIFTLLIGGALAFAWVGMRGFQKSIGLEKAMWDYGTNKVKVIEHAGGKTDYSAGNPAVGKLTLAEYHAKLPDMTAQNRVPWYFWAAEPFVRGNLDQNRVAAQKAVFDGQVLEPIVAAARLRMQEPRNELPDQEAVRHVRALKELFNIQAEFENKTKAISALGASNAFAGLLAYTLQGSPSENEVTNLVAAFSKTYVEGRASAPWTEKLSEGSKLENTPALRQGIRSFVISAGKAQEKQEGDQKELDAFADQIKGLQAWENALRAQALSGAFRDDLPDIQAAAAQRHEALRKAMESLESRKVVARGTGSVEQAYVRLIAAAEATSSEAIKPVEDILRIHEKKGGLFKEALEELDKAKKSGIVAAIQENLQSRRSTGLAELDARFLAATAGDYRAFEARLLAYERLAGAGAAPAGDLLGKLETRAAEVNASMQKAIAAAANYNGPWQKEFSETAQTLGKVRAQRVYADVADNYVATQAGALKGLQNRRDANFALLSAQQVNFFEKLETDLRWAKTDEALASRAADLQRQAAQARRALVELYQKANLEELRAALGFPLVWSMRGNLGLPDLKKVRKVVNAARAEMQAPQLWSAGAYPAPIKLRDALKRIEPLMGGLSNEAGEPQKVKVRILRSVEETRSFANQNRIVTPQIGDEKPAIGRCDWTRESVEVGGKIHELFSLSTAMRQDDKEETVEGAGGVFWGVLELIKQCKPEHLEREANGKKWKIRVPYKDGYFPIELEFEQPLPDVKDWINKPADIHPEWNS